MASLYQSYFGLAETPFSIAPAPRYLFMSQRHQEALAHLLYGVNGEGGFVLLTGEVGTGKTTICRCLLEQIPESCDVAYVFNPKLTVAELLSTICVEFGIACPPGTTSIKVFVDCINTHLLDAHARGRHAVLIIDEAQNLSAEVLEQMRLLTNLETSERKLLQIILLGQPELAAMLERPELRQLAQRIVARYHLGPLSKAEVAAYVRHRLEVAGTQRPLFPPALMGRLHRLSGGVPASSTCCATEPCWAPMCRARSGSTARRWHRRRAKSSRQQRPGAPACATRWRRGCCCWPAPRWRWRCIGRSRGQSAAPALTAAKPAAARPEAAKAAAALPDALAWPAAAPRSGSEAMAYSALFRAWGAEFQGVDACRQAEGLGLRCRTARGGVDELRELNRPAVLQMRDEQGREFHATLTALDREAATFAVAGETGRSRWGALAAQWSGHYSLFWRLPPAVQGTLRPGDRGAAVAWLGGQLAQLQGRTVESAGEPVFDEAMLRRVKQFQFARGLIPDGNVGAQTLNPPGRRNGSGGAEAAPR